MRKRTETQKMLKENSHKTAKSHCRGAQSLSCVSLCVTPWVVTQQAPLSMGFFCQKKVLKHLELIILMKSITTATEKREKKKKIQNQLQNIVVECTTTLYQNIV